MYKILNYIKYLGIFILFVIGIAVIASLINLTGINTKFVNKLSIILTAVSFFLISTKASQNSKEKGYLLGIKLSIIFILFLIITNLIFFKSPINLDRIIYYIILLASSILGGSFGKNFNIKKLAKK
ncbi:MAG: TIGR04086 family membrane protein [Firmicutes bacterium]|nr:TIGR04086 family membrane protein [Bacillota bacterium]